jgi:hypothetical protein
MLGSLCLSDGVTLLVELEYVGGLCLSDGLTLPLGLE